MSTPIIIVIGILLAALVFYVDFKVVGCVIKGGLKTSRQRFLLIYLPVGLWLVFNFVSVLYYGTDVGDCFKRLAMIVALIYGLGFSLYYFIGPNTSYWPLLIGGAMAVYVTFYAADTAGLRFNLTPSMPKGVYTLEPTTDKPERGDLVTFCLEPDNPFTVVARERDYIGSGTCPSGLKPFLKKLAGLPGDMVEASPDGIVLNGKFLAGTGRPECDSQRRLVPASLLKDGTIPEGMALVISQQHGGSFDSRHFGLVPLDSLQKVTPILTNKETSSNAASN